MSYYSSNTFSTDKSVRNFMSHDIISYICCWSVTLTDMYKVGKQYTHTQGMPWKVLITAGLKLARPFRLSDLLRVNGVTCSSAYCDVLRFYLCMHST